MKTEYSTILNKLLSSYNDLSEKSFCFTAYFPYGDNPDRSGNLQEEFRAQILECLKNSPDLDEYKFLRTNLADKLSAFGQYFDYNKKGFALFCKFTIDKESKGNPELEPETDVKYANLHLDVVKESTIDKYFDLDQLIANQNFDKTTLILELQRYGCRFLSLEQNELSEMFTMDNKNAIVDEVQSEVRMDNKREQGWWNIGEDTQWILEEDKHFLEGIASRIDSLNIDFDYMVVFHSTNFTHILDSVKNHLDNYKFKAKVVFIEKNLQLFDSIKDQVLHEIKSLKSKEKNDYFNQAKEKYTHFVTDWSDICNASQSARIETLFIKPDLIQEGYVLDNDLVFTKPVENAKQVSNIGPWLINSVISHGGNIRIFFEPEFESAPEIAAKLRF